MEVTWKIKQKAKIKTSFEKDTSLKRIVWYNVKVNNLILSNLFMKKLK